MSSPLTPEQQELIWRRRASEADNLFPYGEACEALRRMLGLPSSALAADMVLSSVCHIPVQITPTAGTAVKSWIPGGGLAVREAGPTRRYRIMMIGKMPGYEEEFAHRCFVGKSGQLLRDACADVGLNLGDIYVTNVVRFCPPAAGVLKPYWLNECRPFLLREIIAVRPELIVLLGADAVKQFFGHGYSLEKVRAVPYALDDFSRFGKDLERWSDELHAGTAVKVIATIHPAAVLRETAFLSGLKADLASICNAANTQAGPMAKLDYRRLATAEELRKVVDELLNSQHKRLAVDCEWGGGRPFFSTGRLRTVQFSWAERTAAVVPLCKAGGEMYPDALRKMDELKRLFVPGRFTIIGHNLRADALWLHAYGIPIMENEVFDTCLADHILLENAEHGLESCALRHTDMGRYDADLNLWLKDNKYGKLKVEERGYLDVPDDVLFPYAAADADAAFRLAAVYEGMLNDPKNEGPKRCYYKSVLPSLSALHEVETRGFKIDRERLIYLSTLYADARQAVLDELQSAVHQYQLDVGCLDALQTLERNPFNPRSTPQMQWFLFGAKEDGGLGLTPLKTTGKPAQMWADVSSRLDEEALNRLSPATDTETLEALQDQHPLVSKIHDFKLLDQVIKNFLPAPESTDGFGAGNYLKGLLGAARGDDRVHTTLSQMSKTGRHRSSEPNLQNLPKKQESELHRLLPKAPDLRSGFIVDPDCILIEGDYRSAEIFTLGYLANSKKLVEDARSDLHSRGAVKYFGAPKWVGFEDSKPPDEEWLKIHKAIRTASKTIGFGIPYQRGANALSREIVKSTKGMLSCSREQAQGYIDSFYRMYPDVRTYVEFCKSRLEDPGWLENPFGRRRRGVTGADQEYRSAQERELVNFPIQSTVADALNIALYRLVLWRRLNPGRAEYRILLPVHDAVLLEVHKDSFELVYREVLPDCMSGVVIPSWHPSVDYRPTEPFNLDIDIQFGIRWGEYLGPKSKPEDVDELRRRGVPAALLPELKGVQG